MKRDLNAVITILWTKCQEDATITTVSVPRGFDVSFEGASPTCYHFPKPSNVNEALSLAADSLHMLDGGGGMDRVDTIYLHICSRKAAALLSGDEYPTKWTYNALGDFCESLKQISDAHGRDSHGPKMVAKFTNGMCDRDLGECEFNKRKRAGESTADIRNGQGITYKVL